MWTARVWTRGAARALGERIGCLLPAQEAALTAAIHAAFDLE
jgi:hypothetical protein